MFTKTEFLQMIKAEREYLLTHTERVHIERLAKAYALLADAVMILLEQSGDQ
jgi:hypothetical protein